MREVADPVLEALEILFAAISPCPRVHLVELHARERVTGLAACKAIVIACLVEHDACLDVVDDAFDADPWVFLYTVLHFQLLHVHKREGRYSSLQLP